MKALIVDDEPLALERLAAPDQRLVGLHLHGQVGIGAGIPEPTGSAASVLAVELLSDGSVCEPCAGTPIDCTNGATTIQSCDDGDPFVGLGVV